MSTTFADLGVRADLVRALADRGITEPFPVQAATIPDALAGRDVLGRAPTGSGKTLAFGIPLVANLRTAKPRAPRALVLAPTRELAAQIMEELAPLARVRGRRVAAVYGGVGYGAQHRALRKGVDLLVACPGRLADLMAQNAVSLASVETVVIDEADRMADMGFLPQVRRLLDETRADRRTILFSATLDGDVAVLTRDYQQDPVRHEIGPSEPDMTAMQHHFVALGTTERVAHTARLVQEHGSTVVFCRTRHIVDRVVKQLNQADVDAAPIHGGRSQAQRDRALDAFKRGRVQVLVATDVAARGIHVDGVGCVVHYDLAEDAKAYVHRSGRTARAGESGVVVTLVPHERIREAHRLGRDVGIEVAVTDEHGRPVAKPAPAPRANGARKGAQGAGRQGGKPQGQKPQGTKSRRPQSGGGRGQQSSRSQQPSGRRNGDSRRSTSTDARAAR